ncbi:MAG: hypothetical protein AB1435_03595 [Chloroflexota bacterium]
MIGLIVDTLTEQESVEPARRQRSILELAGLGADTWGGIDPHEYIDRLRDKWDERSW